MSQAQAQAPKSVDVMVNKLSNFLLADLAARSERFCIQNEPLEAAEIAAHDGLLGLFMFKASENCHETMKKKLPLYFESEKSALIDVVPMTESSELNLFSLWVHLMHFSVEEEIRRIKREKRMQNGLIPLDDLYRQWHQAVSQQKYLIKSSGRSPQSVTAGQGA